MRHACSFHDPMPLPGCEDCEAASYVPRPPADYGEVEIRPRRSDPSTAKPGAKHNAADVAAIIALLRTTPLGMNSREISEALGRPRECISPCLRPLERAGLLRVLGKRLDPVVNCTVLIWGI